MKWEDDEITYEADPKHVKLICDEAGIEKDSKGLEAPAVRERPEDLEKSKAEDEMSKSEAARYRAVAARANY